MLTLHFQASCLFFPQAILFRKLVVPEMEDVMMKVAKLSIKGAQEHVRLQCRQVCAYFTLTVTLIT